MRYNVNPFELSSNRRFAGYTVRRSTSFAMSEFGGSAPAGGNHRGVEVSINQWLITAWLIIALFGVGILSVRAAYLQIIQGKHFGVVADGNRIRIVDVKANRGIIYDRNNKVLVENVAGFAVVAIPVDLPEDAATRASLIDEISQITAVPAPDLEKLLAVATKHSYQPIVLAENITQDQAIAIRILSGRYPGVTLRTYNYRHYLLPENQLSLSHVLGYPGKIEESKREQYLATGYSFDDYVGKAGVELSYEKELKGVNGKQQVEVDALGEAKEVLATDKPIPGKNLVLTIDAELQAETERALRSALTQFNKDRGAVVALDPRNGEVLALVSIPGYDNNLFSRGVSQADYSSLINDPAMPLFNRTISGAYPSGSTFKLIMAAAALQEGIITPQTTVNSSGGISVGQWFFPDWKAGGHGVTNVVKAIAESVNTFFYTVGGGYNDIPGLGVDKIMEYARKFHLNEKLGIDLPNENEGFLPSREWKEKTKNERWYIGDTYNVSIGQGDIIVTPLQIASWTSVFANGGTLYRPHVAKDFIDEDTGLVQSVAVSTIDSGFIKPEHVAVVNQGMREGVLSGSGRRLSTLPISAASKTGTAQWSSTKPPHAWVTAYAPYENPQIVLTVLLEEGEEGSRTAMPVVYDVLNWWAKNRSGLVPAVSTSTDLK